MTCADGMTHRTRHLLANVAPSVLDELLGRQRDAEPEGSQLKINMLLSRLPRLRDDKVTSEQAFAGTFHANEGYEQLQTAYEEADAGAIPSLPPCELYCHSLTDPTILSPELQAAGVQTLTLFGLHMPARLFDGDRHDQAKRDAVAATLVSVNSVLAEPIEDCLLSAPSGEPCLEALTPVELEQRAGDARRPHLSSRPGVAVCADRRGRRPLGRRDRRSQHLDLRGRSAARRRRQRNRGTQRGAGGSGRLIRAARTEAYDLKSVTALGMALLVIGAVVAVAEAHYPTHGIAGGLGVVLMAIGAVVAISALGAGLALGLLTGAALAGIGAGVVTVSVRKGSAVRGRRIRTGAEGMIGHVGVVRDWVDSNGRVALDGSLWRARRSATEEDGLHAGDQVVVEQLSGLTVSVRKAEEWELS